VIKVKYYFLILALILLLAVFLMWYYLLFPKQNPLKLLNELYQKEAQVKKYSLNYSFDAMFGYGSMLLKVKGNESLIKINESSKTTAEASSEGYNYTIEYYSLPEGRFKCSRVSMNKSILKVKSGYECEEVKSENITKQIIQPQQMATTSYLDLLKNWTQKGIVNISFNGTRKIIDRECYNFKYNVNVEKLINELNYSNYSGYLRNSNLTFFECLDKDFGLPLLIQEEFIINATSSNPIYLNLTLRATSLSFNVGINKIGLPIPLKDVKKIPKFGILNTSCEVGSNQINVIIKAKENLSGTATLNVADSRIEEIYLNKKVDGNDHYCFTVSNITSGTLLTAELFRLNDSSGREFVISIDCPEIEGRNVYPSIEESCIKCNKGEYCLAGESTYGYKLLYYIFDKDLPGSHQICIWPNSDRGYLWSVDSIKIYKKIQLVSTINIGKILKNERVILNFTLPSNLSNYYFYEMNLTIGNSTDSSFCFPKWSYPLYYNITTTIPPEIKKFDTLNTSCEANSNEVNVTIKALENISGIANISVSHTNIEYIYPNKTVTGYNHYCFTLSNITADSQLSFEFKSINDSYARYFVIGIDCPEAEGKRVYSPLWECINCSKGKYCSMGTSEFASYTFDSDLLGTHEICTWPTSPEGYLWKLDSITVYRKTKLTAQKNIGVILKNQTRVLTFVLPSNLSKYYSYWIYLTINNSTSLSYCSIT
jgi:hypothetical protein